MKRHGREETGFEERHIQTSKVLQQALAAGTWPLRSG